MHKTHISFLAISPLLLAAAGIASGNDDTGNGEPKPKPPQGARGFMKGMFSPESTIRSAAGAGISQGTNTPSEWGQGAAGYGRRFANAFGKHLINHTIHYTVAKMRHEEFGFRPSGKQGFGPRLKYALLSTVITHKTTTGNKTVAVGELAGAFGSGLISRGWQPASTATFGAGIASGGITLGVDAGMHVVREFWPEIRHPHQHHAPLQPAPAAAALPVAAHPEDQTKQVTPSEQ